VAVGTSAMEDAAGRAEGVVLGVCKAPKSTKRIVGVNVVTALLRIQRSKARSACKDRENMTRISVLSLVVILAALGVWAEMPLVSKIENANPQR
jgi:hypothetical protein